jgi:hypothetical protein
MYGSRLSKTRAAGKTEGASNQTRGTGKQKSNGHAPLLESRRTSKENQTFNSTAKAYKGKALGILRASSKAKAESNSISFSANSSKSCSSSTFKPTASERKLTSLRHSIRSSLPPPKKKKESGTQACLTRDQTLSLSPYQHQKQRTADELFAFSMTPIATDSAVAPKTPKSMLKDQLDMTADESLLCSPGCSSPPNCCQQTERSAVRNSNIAGLNLLELDRSTTRFSPFSSHPAKATYTESLNLLSVKSCVSLDDEVTKTSIVEGIVFWNSLETSRHNLARAQGSLCSIPENHPSHQGKASAIQRANEANTMQVVNAAPLWKGNGGVCCNHQTKQETAVVQSALKESTAYPYTPLGHSFVSRVAPNEEFWADVQVTTLSNWLNFVLCPNGHSKAQVFSSAGSDEPKLADQVESLRVEPALRTLYLHQQMASGRAVAHRLLQSSELKKIRSTINEEVASMNLAIRPDRDLYSDLTQRRKILLLLQCYETPWLQLGLETLFCAVILPEASNQNVLTQGISSTGNTKAFGSHLTCSLRNFIVNKVLSDTSVLAKYSKRLCKVPSGSFETRYRAEMRALILRRLLLLIFFLDRAKQHNLIEKAPRLFTKAAFVKSSRDVLVSLCRDFLASAGDISKHLRRVGLNVYFKQRPIDEVDMQITNFAIGTSLFYPSMARGYP